MTSDKNMLKRCLLFIIIFILTISISINGFSTQYNNTAEYENAIYFAMTAPFTGVYSLTGKSMRAGIEAAFYAINERGGIDGQKLYLVAKDDAYEPYNSLLNIKKFISYDRYLGFIGNIGPHAERISIDQIQDTNMLLLGSYSGGLETYFSGKSQHVINYRPNIISELNVLKDLIKNLEINMDEIMVFIPDDDAFQKVVKKVAGYYTEQEIEGIQTKRLFINNSAYVSEEVAQVLKNNNDIKNVYYACRCSVNFKSYSNC